MDYVLGFIFSERKQLVLLIEKKRPSWQAGKLNGIGGKIEPGETALQAIVRETREETGLSIDDWRHYATMKFNGSEHVYVFEAVTSFDVFNKDYRPPTDELLYTLHVNPVRDGSAPRLLTNIPWLVSMSFDTGFAKTLTVDYGEFNS